MNNTINPWEQFQNWWQEAQNIGLKNFNAGSLATADEQGKVTCRTVLLKTFSPEKGFVFYTNLNSRKGMALQKNKQVAMLFYWDKLQKQVKIEGVCKILSGEQTIDYFHTRARESQIGAWASKQSSPLASRQELLDSYNYFEKKFAGEKQIPLPDYWRGVAITPKEIEFWQSGDFRLHQRLRFFFTNNNTWQSQTLSP